MEIFACFVQKSRNDLKEALKKHFTKESGDIAIFVKKAFDAIARISYFYVHLNFCDSILFFLRSWLRQ